MNKSTTTSNQIDGNWYRIILIDEDPFIVIGAQQDFSIGRIEIYSAVWYSITEASKNFNEKRHELVSEFIEKQKAKNNL